MSLINVGGVNVFSPNRNPTFVVAQPAPQPQPQPGRGPEGGHDWRPRPPKHHRHHCHKPKRRCHG